MGSCHAAELTMDWRRRQQHLFFVPRLSFAFPYSGATMTITILQETAANDKLLLSADSKDYGQDRTARTSAQGIKT